MGTLIDFTKIKKAVLKFKYAFQIIDETLRKKLWIKSIKFTKISGKRTHGN